MGSIPSHSPSTNTNAETESKFAASDTVKPDKADFHSQCSVGSGSEARPSGAASRTSKFKNQDPSQVKFTFQGANQATFVDFKEAGRNFGVRLLFSSTIRVPPY